MIKHEGGKWVVYSEDGKKHLGTYNSKDEAVKRIRQVEYFKAHPKAKSEDTTMSKRKELMLKVAKKKMAPKAKSGQELIKNEPHAAVKNPNKEAGKVPSIKIPTVSNLTADGEKVYAAIQAMSPVNRKLFASNLMDQLTQNQDRINSAIELAKKLENEGLCEEDFAQLSDYTQYDILMQLLNNSTDAANKRKATMALLVKGVK